MNVAHVIAQVEVGVDDPVRPADRDNRRDDALAEADRAASPLIVGQEDVVKVEDAIEAEQRQDGGARRDLAVGPDEQGFHGAELAVGQPFEPCHSYYATRAAKGSALRWGSGIRMRTLHKPQLSGLTRESG